MTAPAAAPHNRVMTHHARVALAIAALLAAAGTAAVAEQTCQLAPVGTAEVAAVRDGRTLLLRDGSDCALPQSRRRLAARQPWVSWRWGRL
jgi:hypothetical protein